MLLLLPVRVNIYLLLQKKKLSEADHKNIVKFYDSIIVPSTKHADTSEVYILMEYCFGGNLVDIFFYYFIIFNFLKFLILKFIN